MLDVTLPMAEPEQTWISTNEAVLKAQSRSFAIPILNLSAQYRLPVMVQYNINKLLDTIEDAPALVPADRVQLIQALCNALQKRECDNTLKATMLSHLPAEEAPVFRHYPEIIALFTRLSNAEQTLGLAWSLRMANGMCEFLQKSIETAKDLNQYCYYVAGTVGCYLTELLSLHGNNMSETISQQLLKDAVAFGLFLQKLNVIRDYHEDHHDKQRQFWPKRYFVAGSEPVHILNRLCAETLNSDVPTALRYAQGIPAGNASFENFIRFILLSGLDYLKLLINNKKVFNTRKIKLPKILIQTLYQRVAKLSREEFADLCQERHEELLTQIASTDSHSDA